jgi:hypothetical protein
MAFPNPTRVRATRVRRLLAWYAAAALALAAILPGLGVALQATAPGLVTIDICSAAGKHSITLAAADTPGGELPASPDARPHCPLCTAPGGSPGLPPPGLQPLAAAAGIQPRLAASDAAGLPASRFRHALSRGPPILA